MCVTHAQHIFVRVFVTHVCVCVVCVCVCVVCVCVCERERERERERVRETSSWPELQQRIQQLQQIGNSCNGAAAELQQL